MPVIHDEEFGKITIRRSAKASQVRLRLAPDGTLRASLPMYAPLFLVKRLLKSSRNELRELLKTHPKTEYVDGMIVGKSHHLFIKNSDRGDITVKKSGQNIVVHLPEDMDPSDGTATQHIRNAVINALRLEAKSYLPKRLAYIANTYGFRYNQVRFSHSSGRWGSCSSAGTISLNIALMKLPFELIDYVLIHELAHTVHMNHSQDFWSLVESADPLYKQHRRAIKDEAPSV